MLSVINLAIFMWVAKSYKYKREFLDQVQVTGTTRELEMEDGVKGKVEGARIVNKNNS